MPSFVIPSPADHGPSAAVRGRWQGWVVGAVLGLFFAQAWSLDSSLDPWTALLLGFLLALFMSASLGPGLLAGLGLLLPMVLSPEPYWPPLIPLLLPVYAAVITRLAWWPELRLGRFGALLFLLGAIAISAEMSAAIAALLVLTSAWLCGGRLAAPRRGVLTVLNTVCGHGSFFIMCLLLPLLLPLWIWAPRRLVPPLLRLGCRLTLLSPPTFCWRWSDERRTTAGPAILIGNHASVLDILSSLATPGWPRVIIAKRWVFRSPVLAAAARIGGMVPVEQSLQPVAVAGYQGRDVVIFAEGSRSVDGSVQRFRRGALALLEQLQRPLQVMLQVGSWHGLAPKQPWIRPIIMRTVLSDGPPPPYDKTWLQELRHNLSKRGEELRAQDLGHVLSRCDRWEALAHRGCLAALLWLRAEWSGLWRLAPYLPAGPLAIRGDPSGVLWAAWYQLRPAQALSSDPAACIVRVCAQPPAALADEEWLLLPRAVALRWAPPLGRAISGPADAAYALCAARVVTG